MAQDRGSVLLGATWMLVALTVPAIAARFYTQVVILNNLGASDWLMLLAVLLNILAECFLTEAVHWGVGKHITDLSKEQVIQAVKYDWYSQAPATLATCVARISIAILLLRLFGSKMMLRWYLYIITALQTVIGVLLVIVMFVQCRPLTALWGATAGSCWSPAVEQDIAYLYQSILTIIDLTFVLFPVMIIWNLNMRLKTKLGLVTILSIGLLAMIASIIKTVEVRNLSGHLDFTYEIVDLSIWAVTEQSLVIIVGCVPTLRSLFTQRLSKPRGISYVLRRYGANPKSGYKAHSDATTPFPHHDAKEQSFTSTSDVTHKLSRESGKDDHDQSQETILPKELGSIVKTTRMTVGYGPAAERERAREAVAPFNARAKPEEMV